ncbi:MAG: M28 family peptidase [Coriobacteriales bacterium]|jgi:aminopeptidase YwaD|nr:M28 family peptidase [Coriobacteriales bacterium]
MKNHTALLQKHMTMLCEIIGARPTGSVENKAATDYVIEILNTLGFNTHRQEFDCIDWRNSGATLTIDGQDTPIQPAEYSLPCEIEAEFVCIDTLEALRKADVSKKIAVLYGELCKEPLMPKGFVFYNPDEHKQIIALLEEKSPTAIITVSATDEHIIQDGDFTIPCAVVQQDSLDVFIQNVGRRARLSIKTERIPTQASNVIATYGSTDNTVCFTAHIDTKPTTPGALDNASGVSVLLALAEAVTSKEYPYRIEIALLNGEDYYSTPGEVVFMNELTPRYSLAVNVDGVGLKNNTTSVSFYDCPSSLEERILESASHFGIERIDPWPMGDHMIFASFGIPTIALTASSIFTLIGNTIHTPDDDMKNIDIDILDQVVQFLLDCIH